MTHSELESAYKNKKILITGGLGFLGSNIAHELVKLGAEVTTLCSLNPLYGGNRFNVESIKDKIRITIGDIRDMRLMKELVLGKDIIFNLAAQVSYIDSSKMPFEDLDVNCRGHLTLLEACREVNKNVKIIFSSLRMVLGKIEGEQADETYPTNPLSLYGIHKLTGEKYHLMYYKDYGIPTTVLRIANPYGIRQQIKHSKYSLPGWFMRLAMEGKPIKIFGDGNQLRDYIYVSDIVEAFLGVGAMETTNGEIFNCGSGTTRRFRDMAETIVKVVGRGSVEYVPWPKDYERVETGDVSLNIAKLSRAIGWFPHISLEEGIQQMCAYYQKYKEHYIE